MGRYALILYGCLRSYKKGYNFTKKNFFDINDIDIFISTYKLNNVSSHLNVDNKLQQNFDNIFGVNLKKISFIEDADYSKLIEILKDKLKLVDFDLYINYQSEIDSIKTLEDWNIFYKKLLNKNNKGFYLLNNNNYQYLLHEVNMLYHRLNAFNIMEQYSIENNIKYDGVIIYRPDVYFKIKLDLSKFYIHDDIIYFRLDFMFISSHNGIKKLVNGLLNNFYKINNTPLALERIKIKTNFYLSEVQHNIFLWDKSNYTYAYDILNSLNHYRAVDNKNDMPMSCSETIDLDIFTDKFYIELDLITSALKNIYKISDNK